MSEYQLLPPRLTQNIHSIMDTVCKHDYDWVSVIHGRNRTGKTSLSTLILLTAEPSLYSDVCSGIYDTTLARYVWTLDDMMDTVRKLHGAAICYQEARMLGREAMRKWNIRMVRVMTTVAHRNIFYILTFPRFSMLDPYIRDRAMTVARTFTRDRGRGYSRWSYRLTGETSHDSGLRFAFDSLFRDAKTVVPELWARIMEKEERIKDDILMRHGRDTEMEDVVDTTSP